ncbi:MAG: mechanosensitive ion channel [Planctomycetes bacterium]|nr:mechanosensitive ion channel [Planctomycetota bacterium]
MEKPAVRTAPAGAPTKDEKPAPSAPLEKPTGPKSLLAYFIQCTAAYRKGTDKEANEARLAECMDLASAGLDPSAAGVRAEHVLDVLERFWEIKPEEIPADAPGFDYSRAFSREKATFRLTMIKNRQGQWRVEAGTILSAERLWPDVREWEPLAQVKKEEAVPPEASTPPPTIGEWVEGKVPGRLMGVTFLLKDWQWLGLFLLVGAGVVCDRLLAWLFVKVFSRWLAGREIEEPDDEARRMERPFGLAVMAFLWWVGLPLLNLSAAVNEFMTKISVFLLASAVVWIVYRMVDVVCAFLSKLAARTSFKMDDLLVPLVRKTLKIFVVAFGLIFIAGNLGIDVRTMLTGMGIGGVAVALASKDTVENLFGSFTVLLDRPFQIGDRVKINDVEGWVQEVGFRSTRIRTASNSLVTVPNAKLVGAFIDNYGPHTRRPFHYALGLKESVTADRVESFRDRLRTFFEKISTQTRDRWNVYVSEIGGTGTKIQVQGYIRAPDNENELSERERLLLEFKRMAQETGVELA